MGFPTKKNLHENNELKVNTTERTVVTDNPKV
jgi:hypothetical protein